MATGTLWNVRDTMVPPLRSLTPTERFLHRLHAERNGAGATICLARCHSTWDPSALEQALQRLLQRHPALGWTIQGDGCRRAEFVTASENNIPFEVVRDASEDCWKAFALHQMQVPFDLATGPLIRGAVLFAADQSFCDLVLQVHHSLADGRSLAVLMRDWVAFVTEESPAPITPLPQPPAITLRPRHSLWKRFQFVGDAILRQWKFGKRPKAVFPRPAEEEESLARWTLEGATTESLVIQARQQGTTLYGAIAAAVLATIHEAISLEGKSLLMRCPVSTREWVTPAVLPDVIGCFASAAVILRDYDPSVPFWDQARRCRTEVQRFMEQDGPVTTNQFLSAALGKDEILAGAPMLCSVNNLGRFPEPIAPGCSAIQSFTWMTNGTPFQDRFCVYCVTVDGRLTITLRSADHSEQALTTFADRLRQHLISASGV